MWGIDARYDFVHATFDDAAGGNVPRVAPHRAGAGVYYRGPSWFARLGFLHAFDQDRIGENETTTKGYTLLNADLAYTFKAGRPGGVAPEMTIGLRAENLLDDDVRNHVSFKKDECCNRAGASACSAASSSIEPGTRGGFASLTTS
jgi:iron complex outermembrane receptor protein